MKKLNKKGFTLIEIIVVVVVLAVLMAVAVPSVLKYVNEADNAKYMAQGRSVMNMAQTEMVKAYVGDNQITTDELATVKQNIQTELAKDGVTVDKTDIEIYTAGTASQAGDQITITSGAKFTGMATTGDMPAVKVVKCKINGKTIVAVLNDKVYVGTTLVE